MPLFWKVFESRGAPAVHNFSRPRSPALHNYCTDACCTWPGSGTRAPSDRMPRSMSFKRMRLLGSYGGSTEWPGANCPNYMQAGATASFPKSGVGSGKFVPRCLTSVGLPSIGAIPHPVIRVIVNVSDRPESDLPPPTQKETRPALDHTLGVENPYRLGRGF